VTDGVLKVMSKMGISTIASYKGSQVRVAGEGRLTVWVGAGSQAAAAGGWACLLLASAMWRRLAPCHLPLLL